ncbi:HAD-IC family P-type ATPase [Candidatus Nomurabacteria bacterium]|nr:HAD-IC family P-type ATPase [Candidatus Nomurabacteria bacterium]
MKFYQKTTDEIVAHFKSSLTIGLHSRVAQHSLEQHGANALPKKESRFLILQLLWNQIKSPLILILLAAGVVSFVLHEFADAVIIFVTVFLNITIGFFQEFKANESLKKLQSMVKLTAVVLRDGVKKSIPSELVVPGDILFLSSGDKVPVDGRVVDSKVFFVDESVLTGESEPSEKTVEAISGEVSIGDMHNMVFRGTTATAGEAQVVVTATGVHTELGKIAQLVQSTNDDQTPLQIQLTRLSKTIGIIVVGVAISILVLGQLLPSVNYSIFLLFETAIAIAVAAIPEGLAISLTVILAIGMQRILKRKALVRRLLAAETLGSVSVICTDKTGTLTQAKMRVAYYIDETGKTIDQDTDIINAGILCSNASLENPRADETDWRFVGDTTEIALIHAAQIRGVDVEALRKSSLRLDEVPFSSAKKCMFTLIKGEKENMLYLKGAPERVMERCIQNERTKVLFDAAQKYAQQGYRILAFAKKATGSSRIEDDVKECECIGLAVIEDPLRSDVKSTLATAQNAGIRVIMITGDHMRTAVHIAQQLGIEHQAVNICEGKQLDAMSDQELEEKIGNFHVFARVEPRHKVRIVQALQKTGEVVAMTGDGVNDAPALKGADIGVAVGSGTDVAKETADMVLLDDSFSTIVAAVSEGRRIYQNLKKVILYLLSGSFTEVLLIIASIVSGLPLALLPAQILWTNIIQETFPTMALAFDKGDKENMTDPPRKKDTNIFDSEMKAMAIAVTIFSSGLLFALFAYLTHVGFEIAYARTMVFAGLGALSFFYIFSIRSMRYYVWEVFHLDNMYLNIARIVSFGLLLAAIYIPHVANLLHLVPLSLQDWIILCFMGVVNIIVIEFIKMLYLTKQRRQQI